MIHNIIQALIDKDLSLEAIKALNPLNSYTKIGIGHLSPPREH